MLIEVDEPEKLEALGAYVAPHESHVLAQGLFDIQVVVVDVGCAQARVHCPSVGGVAETAEDGNTRCDRAHNGRGGLDGGRANPVVRRTGIECVKGSMALEQILREAIVK